LIYLFVAIYINRFIRNKKPIEIYIHGPPEGKLYIRSRDFISVLIFTEAIEISSIIPRNKWKLQQDLFREFRNE
jgi:hypothetical protein